MTDIGFEVIAITLLVVSGYSQPTAVRITSSSTMAR
jgi:hypothetical protein